MTAVSISSALPHICPCMWGALSDSKEFLFEPAKRSQRKPTVSVSSMPGRSNGRTMDKTSPIRGWIGKIYQIVFEDLDRGSDELTLAMTELDASGNVVLREKRIRISRDAVAQFGRHRDRTHQTDEIDLFLHDFLTRGSAI